VGNSVTSESSNEDSGDQITVSASCAAGKVAFGGGSSITYNGSSTLNRIALAASYPSTTSAWSTTYTVLSNFSNNTSVTITPYVLCSL
jgi:hypothetical protein